MIIIMEYRNINEVISFQSVCARRSESVVSLSRNN